MCYKIGVYKYVIKKNGNLNISIAVAEVLSFLFSFSFISNETINFNLTKYSHFFNLR